MHYKGFTLDDFQAQAIHAIEANKSVVVSAPTGSGKTLIADYIINRDVHKGIRVIYTAPIKALSNQKYKEFSKEYGEDKIGMLTGDVVKNPNATVLIMTTEIYRNMALANDPIVHDISYIIFDEIHYINDVERGYVWEESVIFSKPTTRMLCLSATIPNAREFAGWIHAIKNHPVEVIEHDVRMVPLHLQFYDAELGLASLEDIKYAAEAPSYRYLHGKTSKRAARVQSPSHIELIKEIRDKLPCLFFQFSRQGCQKKAMELAKQNLFPHNPEITSLVREKFSQTSPEINKLASTRILRQTLPFGIGFHHAGLLPVMKDLIEDLFSKGLLKVLYTTETFAVGINMPAKTVCMESLRKFDGRMFRMLDSKEYFQIAGRAGRRGIDTEGFVIPMIDRRDFDYGKLKRLTAKDTTPLTSQFRLSINTVLNLIKQHAPKEIEEILCKSFHSFQQWGKNFKNVKNYRSHSSFEKYKKQLERMGYVTKEGKLSWKGEFSSKIYADEIIIGEIFAEEWCRQLDTYQILLLITCLCYEGRESTEFYHQHPSRESKDLRNKLLSHPYLRRIARFREIEHLTAFVFPLYKGASIFRVIENTNLLEGDVIRLFRQVLDRINQIKAATKDEQLLPIMVECQDKINDCMKEIDAV